MGKYISTYTGAEIDAAVAKLANQTLSSIDTAVLNAAKVANQSQASIDSAIAKINSMPVIKRARISINDSEFRNLLTVPKVLVAGVPGFVIIPIQVTIQVDYGNIFGGGGNVAVSYSISTTSQFIATAGAFQQGTARFIRNLNDVTINDPFHNLKGYDIVVKQSSGTAFTGGSGTIVYYELLYYLSDESLT